MNNTKLPETLEIGQWVVTKDGRTVKITSDDMPDLPYENIERLATGDEIPEFTFEIGNHYGLTKEHFWNPFSKECPKSIALFFNWLLDYKKEVKWTTLSFTEMPLNMQIGVIFKFVSQNSVDGSLMFTSTNKPMVDCIIFGFRDIEKNI